MLNNDKKSLVVGISGASGAIYGLRLLRALQGQPTVESHLVVSESGLATMLYECEISPDQLYELADFHYANNDFFAGPASGSFPADGMVIAPCSMKRLAGIAASYADDLMGRAADVMLKERRRLVLMPRETPLHSGHLEQMLKVSRLGAVLMPPLPAFYQRPAGIEEMVDQSIGRVLTLFGIDNKLFQPWGKKV